jgi:sugar phosphate isomerase/epimerase
MIPAWLTDTVTSDLDRSVHYTLLWGLEAVELRTVGGPGDRVPFVNESKLKRRLSESELPVVSIVPGMFEGPVHNRVSWMNELAAFEDVLAFCERIGCPRITVSAFAPEEEGTSGQMTSILRQAGTAAQRRGVTIAMLNAWNTAHPTGAKLAALLNEVNHPSVMAAWSPAQALRAGEVPLEGLKALGRNVSLVRCSDGNGLDEAWQPALLGDGGVDWPAQIRGLQSAGFDGPLSLEMELEPKSKHGLEQATRLIRLLREVR